MALYVFDGTGNEDEDHDSNALEFFRAFQDPLKNDDPRQPLGSLYLKGIGTRARTPIGDLLAEQWGFGGHQRVREALDRMEANQAAGDKDIHAVGFSRGAATTLDFCHCIQERGIRKPGSDQVVEPSPKIRFLGVWDVVASFGLANLGNTALNIGHHLSLPKSNLQYCFHALALDERRPSFLPIRVEGACEVWFRGVHSDIGGGNENRGLNDVTLRWMMHKAMAAQLPIRQEDIDALKPDQTVQPSLGGGHKLPVAIRTVSSTDRGHYTVKPLQGWASLPDTCAVESESDECAASEIGDSGIEILPLEVRRRVLAMWEAAQQIAAREDTSLDDSKDLLLTLFQGRVSLVATDDDVKRAQIGAAQLVANAIRGARNRGEHRLAPFYVNEALFNTPHLFPVTD